MGQNVLNAPTVFNFYRPTTQLEGSSLLCPQCEILTTANILSRYNFFNRIWRAPLFTRDARLATSIDFRFLEETAADTAAKRFDGTECFERADRLQFLPSDDAA